MTLTLADEVLMIRAQLDYVLERLVGNPALGERPVNWAALDAQHAAEQWATLTDWTAWLRDRYQLHEAVPACWYAHGPLVEELSALRSAWVGSYLNPDAQPGDGTAWHGLLDDALQRIKNWDRTGCADGTHRPNQPLPDDTDHHHREQTIHADLAGREVPQATDQE